MSDTGFDRIAKHLIDNGVSVPPIQNNGHYVYAAIVHAIQGLSMTVPTVSKTCSYSSKTMPMLPNNLTVGGVKVSENGDSGTFYVYADGSIHTS